MRSLLFTLALQAPAEVDLTWQGPPSCGDADFHSNLASYLDGDGARRAVRVAVDIRPDERGHWLALLRYETDRGRTKRELHGRSCAEVSAAAAFVIAVVVDPGVLARDPPASAPAPAVVNEPASAVVNEPAPAVVNEPVLVPVLVPAPAPAPSSAGDPRVALDREPSALVEAGEPRPPSPGPYRPGGFVRAMGGLEAFGLPRVAPQAALAVGVFGQRWRVELHGMYRAPTSVYLAAQPLVGARSRMWMVGARGCGVLRPGVFEVPLCAGAEGGQVVSDGVGFTGARRDSVPWAAAAVGPNLAWAPRRWFALWLGVELAVPLVRGSFLIQRLGEVSRVGPVSLRVGLGLEFRFEDLRRREK